MSFIEYISETKLLREGGLVGGLLEANISVLRTKNMFFNFCISDSPCYYLQNVKAIINEASEIMSPKKYLKIMRSI